MKKTVAFIPVRGGSKSIPLKNIKEIAGKPLVFWTVEAALNSKEIEEVFVSTDSEKIKNTLSQIQNKKLKIIERSEETATDTASTELAMLEFARNYPTFENILLIQATSPLTTSKDINGAVQKYFSGNYDSLLSVVRQKRFIWEEKEDDVKPVNYNPQKRPRRQEFDGFLIENGAIYITSRDKLLKYDSRLSGKVGIYEMPEETYYEIDEPSDWVIVEKLLRRRKNEKIKQKTKNIKMVIFDVDGVFTDGSVYLDKDGKENLRFSRIDGKGIELLRKNNYKIAIISAEESEIVRKRMEKLKIGEIHLGIKDKLLKYEEIKEKYNLIDKEICFCGDDIQDIPVLKKVGFSACPKNAQEEVKKICDYVSDKKGGGGFVRKLCELFNYY